VYPLLGEVRKWRNIMSIRLDNKDLTNSQQMEVAVNGPDGATHLIFCTGMAELSPAGCETYTFLVGPQFSGRQFVGAIVSGALSRIQVNHENSTVHNTDVILEANLVSIDANHDDEAGQVKVKVKVMSNQAMMKLSISYHVSILAELSVLRFA
jgi:hypothetical protein